MGRARTTQRVNLKAVIGTAVIVLVVVVGGLLAAGVLRGRVRSEVLTQTEELVEQGKATMALRHLDQYLKRHPDEVPVLDRFAELLADSVLERGELGRLDRAIDANDRLLRLDPEGARGARDPQRNRRWMVELQILKTELIQAELGRLGTQDAALRGVSESRYGAARERANELIARGADDAEAHRLLAMALEGDGGPNGDVDGAIASYVNALARDPADSRSAERLARLYRDRKEAPEAADRVLDELVRAAADSPEAWLARHRSYRDAGDAARASEALARAVELKPDDLNVVLAAADEAMRGGDDAKAVALLDRLPEAARGRPRVVLLRAIADVRAGRLDEAIERLREALSTARGADADLIQRLAGLLIESGRPAEALPLIERYKRLAGDGDVWRYHLLLGRHAQASSQLTKAIEEFTKAEQALRGRPEERAQVLVERGRCRLALGERSEGVDDLRTAIRLAPRQPLARLALANAIGEGGDQASVDRALAELQQGIVQAPDSRELRLAQLGLLLADRRTWPRFDEVLREAKEVDSLRDDPAIALLEIRRLLLDGRADRAEARLEGAVASHPKSAALWLAWADLRIGQNRLDEALAVLERASAPGAAGDLAAFREVRARVLAQLGRGREAIEVLSEAADSLPSDQRVQILPVLGRMLVARGQFAEARAAYASWKALQPGSADPVLAQLGLAIDTGDIAGAEAALRELRGGAGDNRVGLPYLLGYAEYRLRAPGGDKAARTNEAIAALAPILGDGTEENPGVAPGLAPALMLRGLAYRQLGELETDSRAAADHFEKALDDLNACWARKERRAAAQMIDLLVRLDRFAELDRAIRAPSGDGFDPALARLAAEACLRHDRQDLAADYVEFAGKAAGSASPQFQAWRLAMLDRLGRTPQVEQSLRAQAENRGDAASWLALIRYQAARGQREAAERSIAEMKQAVRDLPAESLEAQAFEALGDLEAAGRAYESALEARPDDPQLLLTAARFDLGSGRPRQALERIERAQAAGADSRPAARLKAWILAELAGDEAAWQRAWEALGPEEAAQGPEDQLTRALVLARHPEAARREEAVGRLEALVNDQRPGDPMAASAREALARLLLDQGRADRAAEVAAVTAISGANPAAVALYTEALIAAGKVDEAGRQLDRLRNLSAGSAVVSELELSLVEARAEAGSIAEELERAYRDSVDEPDAEAMASATFRRLVQLGDTAAEAADRVGRDLADRFPALSWMPAQWYAGRDAFPEALELAGPAIGSDDPAAAFQAARAVLTVVDRSKADPALMGPAAELIERAAARGDLPDTVAILAMLRHFQGRTDPSRFDDEIRIYRELLQSQPENIVYLNNLAWALSEYAGEPGEALALIDRALASLEIRAPELVDTRGVILLRLGRPEEAIEALEEVVRERPNSAIYHFHLARALDAADRAEEARAAVGRAQELGLTASDLEPFEREALDALTAP